MFKKIKNLLFENQSLKQRIFKNAFWLFSGQIFGRLIRVAIVIYAARILGPASWGAFSYAMSFAAFMLIFSDLGINAIVTKEASRNIEMAKKYFSTAFFIKLILLIIGVLILFVAPNLTNLEEAKQLLPLISFILIFDSLRNFGFSISRAHEKMEIEGLNEIATNFFITLFGFIALKINGTSQSLTIAYSAAIMLGFLLIAFQLRHYFKEVINNFDFNLIKPILETAWPFALAGSLGAIMINTDTIIIGWFRSAAEVGYYSAAQRPVQLLYVLPTLFAASLFPSLSRMAKEKMDSFKEVLKNAIKISLIVAIPITIFGIIFGSQIINLLFGQDYQSATLSFQILMLTILVIFPSAIIANANLAADQQKNFIIFSAIGAIGNIILDLLLIPKWGIAGSSFATLVTQIIANSFIWFKMKKLIEST
ncbi:MAG: flippase [bacterium]|nr:flippase [bacterium]